MYVDNTNPFDKAKWPFPLHPIGYATPAKDEARERRLALDMLNAAVQKSKPTPVSDLAIRLLTDQKRDPILNYVIPGLTSWLISSNGTKGKVRLFDMTREQIGDIAPHSHRYDLTCFVLRGQVVNRVWRQATTSREFLDADEMMLMNQGGPGLGIYSHSSGTPGAWVFSDFTYKAGEEYSLSAEEIHSIRFSRGAQVLIAEGPARFFETKVLFPYCKGPHGDLQPVDIANTRPWMFQGGKQ